MLISERWKCKSKTRQTSLILEEVETKNGSKTFLKQRGGKISKDISEEENIS